MSTSIRSLFGIAGSAAAEWTQWLNHVTDALPTSTRRVVNLQPDDLRTAPTELTCQLEALAQALLSKPHEFPVVFYRSWLDDWTVASSNLLMALEPANQSYVLDSVSSTVAFVIEADFVAINQAASLVKQSYKFKDQECDRWSYQAVWDAIDRLSRVPLPKLIVIVTETYGGSRDDQDVVDGCKAAQK